MTDNTSNAVPTPLQMPAETCVLLFAPTYNTWRKLTLPTTVSYLEAKQKCKINTSVIQKMANTSFRKTAC